MNMPDCQEQIYSNEYADYIVELRQDLAGLMEVYGELCYENVAGELGVIHVPQEDNLPELWEAYRSYPKCYALLDTTHLEAMGVERLRRQPFLDLNGQGVILGIVDTGIDYQGQVFRYADGSSRILALWDQTIPYKEKRKDDPAYGTVYTREQLGKALASENPFEIVPSRDSHGHGTFLAGVAAGNFLSEEDFSGVAPLTDLAVVKVKEAKAYLREYYGISEGIPCYQETDLILAVNWLVGLSIRRQQPLVILLALGTNQGGHEGQSYLAFQLRANHQVSGRCICLAAGNETGRGHHYRGYLRGMDSFQEVEFRVAAGELGLVMELWNEIPDTYAIGFVTPTGYHTGELTILPGQILRREFAFEPVVIEVAYEVGLRNVGQRLTGIRLMNPTPGLWKIQIYGKEVLSGRYDLWLPVESFIKEETRFLMPDPDTTICDPGNALETITTGAYNHRSGGIDIHSSRGYTRDNGIKPDLVAPGVEIFGPEPGVGNLPGRFGTRTGTSVAAALTAGTCALLLEYDPKSSGRELQQDLIRGAIREDRTYPNQEWGYGILDVYRTLELMGGQPRR